MTLFLDANIIIYRVEAVDPFTTQLLAVLHELFEKYPQAEFAVSRLSLLECLVKPLREQNSADIARYRDFFESTGLQIIEVSAEIVEMAALLRAHKGLRTPDAIQAASAKSIKGAVTFLTGDTHFRKVPGLNVKLIS